MNKWTRRYYLNSDGTSDLFIQKLNCYEKMFYHALYEYDIEKHYVFCEDINMTISENNGNEIWVNTLKHNKSLFIVNKYMPDKENATTKLEQLIDTGVTVAVRTMFDMLPPYVWNELEEKKGKGNTHYCLFIGYDDDNYYFVEDPGMLKKNSCKMESNNTISVLSKEIIEQSLSCFCEIITISVVAHELVNINNFDYIKDKIIKNYFQKKIEEKIIGREALNFIFECIGNKEVIESITKNFFWIHILYSRRELFSWCLQDRKDQYNEINFTVNCLKKNIQEYKNFYLLIARHSIKENNQIVDKAIDQMKKIIETEDKLMESLANMSYIKG